MRATRSCFARASNMKAPLVKHLARRGVRRHVEPAEAVSVETSAARFEVKDLRGNVDTRLRKLDAGGYDAVILASAGSAPARLRASHQRGSPDPRRCFPPSVRARSASRRAPRTTQPSASSHNSTTHRRAPRAWRSAHFCEVSAAAVWCPSPRTQSRWSQASTRRAGRCDNRRSGLRDSVEGDATDAQMLGERLADDLLELGAASYSPASLA